MFELRYSNEDDRAYGLAGMVISIASLDALDRITEVFLDSDGPMVSFTHSYYFSSSPSISPKAVWHNLLANLQLTGTIVIGNVMARSLVRMGQQADPETFEVIREMVRREGESELQLEAEESDALFEKMMRHSLRLFNNPRLHPAVRDLAGVLSRRRRLSVVELAEELDLLRI